MIASVQDLVEFTGKKVENPESLQIYLDTAYGIVCNFLGYPIDIAYVTVIAEGHGSIIQLKHKPINFVYRIEDYKTKEELYLFSSGIEDNDDYLINNEFVEFRNIVFPKGKLKVSYVYGYGEFDFSGNTIGGHDAQSSDFFATAWGGAAPYHVIYETINGGGANSTVQIETETPPIFKQTVLRIAALLLSEADQNIGVSSKSFGDSGMRTFINYTNFEKYLSVLQKYRLVTI